MSKMASGEPAAAREEQKKHQTDEEGWNKATADRLGYSVRWDYWLNRTYWTPEQGASLLYCYDPDRLNTVQHRVNMDGVLERIDEIKNLAADAQSTGKLANPASPTQWVAWANGNGIHVPLEMSEVPGEKAEDEGQSEGLWWQTEYDILDFANDFGARLVAEGKNPSLNAVATKVVDHINNKERRKVPVGTRARHISITRLKKGPLKGWRYMAK